MKKIDQTIFYFYTSCLIVSVFLSLILALLLTGNIKRSQIDLVYVSPPYPVYCQDENETGSITPVGNKEKKVNIEPKETTIQLKENRLPLSNWIPIDLPEFKKGINGKIEEINQKILATPKVNLGKEEKQKRQDLLQRSLKIQWTLLSEYNLMDENKNGKIDYSEFNKRTVSLAEKIYLLRHTTVQNKKNGLYDLNWKDINNQSSDSLDIYLPPEKNILRVIIEAGIYQDISNSLIQYKKDIESDNNDYYVSYYLCNNCTKKEIKKLLNSGNTVGGVFVGDLPTAWYKHKDFYYEENFPIDQYFMDLNGDWLGSVKCGYNNCCFTKHSGDINPEIFISRITAPDEQEEVDLINNYFTKNHYYRSKISSRYNLPHRSLSYIDDPWSYWGQLVSQNSISLIYPSYDLVDKPKETTNEDYIKRLTTGYEHLLVMVHSNPHGSCFEGSITHPECVNWQDIKNQKPTYHFYNLFACSNALYTVENYMAGWYVFQKSNYGLVAIGSTKSGAMLGFEYFYRPLMTKNFGEAYKDWYLNYLDSSNMGWHGGMTIIGDPTLKIY